MLVYLTLSLAFLFLLLASYQDLRTGEVSEKISRSFIFSIIFLSLLISLFQVNFFILGLTLVVGLGYFLFGFLIYHLGQWGGGDVKILAGIGLTLGLLEGLNFPFPNSEFFPYYLGYFLNMGIIALPYAFFYGIILGFQNPQVFLKFFEKLGRKKALFLIVLSFFPSLITLSLHFPSLSLIYLVIPLFVLFSLFLKVLEEVTLIKKIPVSQLKEGDVPKEDFSLGGKKISSRNINGLERDEVKEIKKLAAQGKFPQSIEIKLGIKFVPILMLAFFLLLGVGNALELLLP